MSIEKFTKGEWSVWGDWKIECNGNQIATFETADQKPWEGFANARLIASAPKMYQMLKDQSELMTMLDPQTHPNIELDAVKYDIDALLAEARGE